MHTNLINEIVGEVKKSKVGIIAFTIVLLVMSVLAISIFIGLTQLN